MNEQQQHEFLVSYAIDRMAEYLIEDYALSIPAALQFLYNSDIYQKLMQSNTGLSGQSPCYIYELLRKEYETGFAV